MCSSEWVVYGKRPIHGSLLVFLPVLCFNQQHGNGRREGGNEEGREEGRGGGRKGEDTFMKTIPLLVDVTFQVPVILRMSPMIRYCSNFSLL